MQELNVCTVYNLMKLPRLWARFLPEIVFLIATFRLKNFTPNLYKTKLIYGLRISRSVLREMHLFLKASRFTPTHVGFHIVKHAGQGCTYDLICAFRNP